MYLFLASASEQEDLAVTIDVSYSKPSDFSLDPPNYRAGSSITLTCRVEGVVDGLTYVIQVLCNRFRQTPCVIIVEVTGLQSPL